MKIRDNLTGKVHDLVQRQIDRSELNQLLMRVHELDHTLGVQLEDAVGLLGAEVLEQAFVLGWQMAGHPEAIIFTGDDEAPEQLSSCAHRGCAHPFPT